MSRIDPNLDQEEIDVTAIVERLEKLEAENSSQKAEIEGLKARLQDCEESIDDLAGKL